MILVFALLFSSCGKGSGTGGFSRRGKYSVTETETGVCFSAALDGKLTDITFTAPETIIGLSAKSNDGVIYRVCYAGLEINCGGAAVAAAADFSAALTALEEAGIKKDGCISARPDGISVRGEFLDGKLCAVEFSNGECTRKYKVKTEAVG